MESAMKKGLSLKWLNPLLLLGGRHRDRTCDFFRVKEALDAAIGSRTDKH